MNSFAVSLCVLEKIKSDNKVLNELLVRLSHPDNARKVVVDKKRIVLNWYETLASSTKCYELTTWLTMLSYSTGNYDFIEIDLSNFDTSISTFMKIASEVKTQKQLIVYDHNDVKEPIENGNLVEVNGKWVKLYNIDEAISKFKKEDAGKTTYKEKTVMGDEKNKSVDKSRHETYTDSVRQSGDGDRGDIIQNKSDGVVMKIIIGALGAIIAGTVIYYLFYAK